MAEQRCDVEECQRDDHTPDVCGDCPHCAHWMTGHFCEKYMQFLAYYDDRPLRCSECVRNAGRPEGCS